MIGETLNWSSSLSKINDFLWVKIPVLISVRSRVTAAIAADGIYLTAIPIVGALFPALALGFGFIIGAYQLGYGDYESLYTASLPAMLFMLAVGVLSASAGALLWIGFVFADLLISNHHWYGSVSLIYHIVFQRLPLVIPDLYLAILVFCLPLVSRGIRLKLTGSQHTSPDSFVFGSLTESLIIAALVWGWTYIAPVMVRPVYTWNGNVPGVDVIQPVQQYGWVLAVAAGILMTLRSSMERRFLSRSVVVLRAARLRSALFHAPTVPASKPHLIVMGLTSFAITVFLSGVLTTWVDGVALFALLLLLLIVRRRFDLANSLWGRTVRRVPFLVRFVTAVFLNYICSTFVIEHFWYTTRAMYPLLISVVVGVIIFWLLLPFEPNAYVAFRSSRRGS